MSLYFNLKTSLDSSLRESVCNEFSENRITGGCN